MTTGPGVKGVEHETRCSLKGSRYFKLRTGEAGKVYTEGGAEAARREAAEGTQGWQVADLVSNETRSDGKRGESSKPTGTLAEGHERQSTRTGGRLERSGPGKGVTRKTRTSGEGAKKTGSTVLRVPSSRKSDDRRPSYPGRHSALGRQKLRAVQIVDGAAQTESLTNIPQALGSAAGGRRDKRASRPHGHLTA